MTTEPEINHEHCYVLRAFLERDKLKDFFSNIKYEVGTGIWQSMKQQPQQILHVIEVISEGKVKGKQNDPERTEKRISTICFAR